MRYRVIEVRSPPAASVRAGQVRVLNRAVVAFVDLLVIRWMGARLLRYEIVETWAVTSSATERGA
jgi:hypothetical protein